MGIYSFKAVDNGGKLVRGELDASSEMALTTELARKGLVPVSISVKAKARAISLKPAGSRVDNRALVIFTRQFATIIKAGVPIIEGLRVLAEQTEDAALKKALLQVIRDVEGGSNLSGAMSKHPLVFSDLYVNTVVAGESAGILEKVLLRLATVLEEEMENKSHISAALRYPLMVVIAMVIAVIVLSLAVIPNFAKIYMDAHVALPLPTQVMIAVSYLMRHYWYALIGGAFGAFFLFNRYINTPFGRLWWDNLKFEVPVFGKLYTKITMLRFVSMLSVLYQSGLPVLKTLDIVGMTLGNVVLNKEIERIKRDVADGKGISVAVLNSRFFPKLVGFMISVGEKSGSLPMMLDSLGEYFDLEVKTTIKNLTTTIEPLMTAVLGLVVMGMALAIFLPMWSMISVFRG
ncbi:MAG: type II secretion system F family protein [Deltaproteobacteria bacterium]